MNTVTNARPRTWSPRRVSDAVHAVGLSYAAIARNLGCSRPFVSQVGTGRVRSWRVANAIGAAIGRNPWEIWPRLYAPPTVAVAPTEAPSPEPTPEPIRTAC
jgi:lambda repressor-like predicted transcriptional regulator